MNVNAAYNVYWAYIVYRRPITTVFIRSTCVSKMTETHTGYYCSTATPWVSKKISIAYGITRIIYHHYYVHFTVQNGCDLK